MGSSDRPGILEGIGKDFLGVPFSLVLTRGEQHLREAVRTNERLGVQDQRLVALREGQKQEFLAARDTLNEARREREVVERSVAPSLSSLARSAAVTNDRIDALRTSFEEGQRVLDERSQARTDALMGIPAPNRDVNELMASGAASEAELITLARRGALSADARHALQEALPGWKREILTSGILERPDPAREKQLPADQRMFLWEVRRADRTPTGQMRSLTAVARSGQLDPDAHFRLAQRIRALRTGTEGAALSLQELTEQGEDAARQRALAVHLTRAGLIEQQTSNALARAHLEVSTRQAEDTSDIRASSREIARDMAASVELARRQADGIDTLGRLGERQVAELQDIGAGVARVGHLTERYGDLHARQLDHLGALGERELAALQVVGDGVAHVGHLAEHYGDLHARQLDHLGALGERQVDLLGVVALEEARHTEQLQGIGAGVQTLSVIGRAQIELAAGMDRRLDGIHAAGLAQLDELVGLGHGVAVTNELLDGLIDIAEAQRQIADRAARSLTRIDVHLETVVSQLGDIHGTLLQAAEAQRERDLNRDRIAADESFRKAMTVLERGRIDKALTYLDEAHHRWPNDPRATFHRALCHVARDEAARAREDLVETLDMLAPEAGAERASVRLYLARLAWCEALAHRRAGETDVAAERIAEAVELATLATEEDPASPEARVARAKYLCELGATEEALEVLFAVLAHHPDRWSAVAASPAFEPVHDVLQRALADDEAEPFLVRLARDALGLGQAERAMWLLGEVCRHRPRDLLGAGFLEDAGLEPVLDALTERILGEIRAASGPEGRTAEDWYALAVLAMRLERATDLDVLRLFKVGAAVDPHVARRDAQAVRATLSTLAGADAPRLFGVLARDWDQPYPWLLRGMKGR